MKTLEEMGPIVLGMLEPIRALELVEETTDDGRRSRKYRVSFGRTARYWRFDLDAEGKIVNLQPVSE